MNAHDFTIWLRGFLDAAGNAPSAQQIEKVVSTLKQVTPQVAVQQPGPAYRALNNTILGEPRSTL